MITKTSLNRIREILITDNTNEFTDNISEDDESNSDPDYSFSDTESDNSSTDECISKEDSSDAHFNDDDTHINAQSESIEKGGVSWSTQRPTVQGRVHFINIMKTTPGPITVIQTMMDAFKLFLTDEILNEVVLRTNKYARFDDRQLRDKFDHLTPIRTIFEYFVKQLPQHFILSENLTIDEQLVPFRDRCSFVQYMPNKPSKYGLKFWVLCDVDSRASASSHIYTTDTR
ncbi:unnamed protein product [Rotaria sordida]|uniref:PiggyBac transposable element-derived protein domain-containing protein n=1 Tax=Rotaria sordida TaxID=392033 RepID=A0A814VEN7_9BILA|nr:unnamed protein product [Rotaria sordida]